MKLKPKSSRIIFETVISSLPKGRATSTNIYCSLQKDEPKWDPWIFKDDDVYRLFYLLGSKKAMPFFTVGTLCGAISKDLENWQDIGVVIAPNSNNSWESGRILAGSTYKEDGIYYLFYSASGEGEAFLTEEICLATSTDCSNWQHHSPQKLFSNLDERGKWYGEKDSKSFYWRDPYIVKDFKTGKYYMFICAYLKEVECGEFGGCIGLAVSNTLAGPYEILPPVAAPAHGKMKEWPYFHMERPQIIERNGKYNLFFSCWLNMMNPTWINKIGRNKLTDSSLYWYVSDNINGPFDPVSDYPVVKGSEKTRLYGTNFFTLFPDNPEELFAYGWNYASRQLEVSPSQFKAYWNNDEIIIAK